MTDEDPRALDVLHTRCCIVGGGPAGMMLGLLLARAGVEVLVLEKHEDFLRDFRGDTIHPSTLELMYELGLLDELLERPHQEARQLTGYISDVPVVIADFSHLPTHCRFIALMPQWDFLDFLAEHARRYPTFHLKMRAEVTDVIEEDDRIAGVRVTTPEGPRQIRADLVVGADGRRSIVRERAGLVVDDLGAPIDVLWMRLSRKGDDPEQPMGRFDRGRIFIMIYRGEYWQCAFVIPKGGFDGVRERGLEAFRQEILRVAPFLTERVEELRSWDDVKLLTVKVDRLRRWCRDGLLCIGDAAHAMSPIGGVGINLAIQDAVAAANILFQPLKDGVQTTEDLLAVQKRREFPTRLTQGVQVFAQDRIIGRVISGQGQGKLALAWPLRLLRRFPFFRRIPARLIGLGARPEHVRTPDAFAASTS